MTNAMAPEAAGDLAVASCPDHDSAAQHWGGTAIAVVTNQETTVEVTVEECPPSALTFEEMLDRYQAEIFRYAMQLTRNQADADDLYQETLMKAYRAFERLDGEANYRAWLYRICTNTFLSDRRKRGREEMLDDVQAQAIPAASTDHAGRLDARDLLQEVSMFVDSLPPKQRVALTLRKYHELEYADIAATLRSSEAAARASVHEALRKLRDAFGDRI